MDFAAHGIDLANAIGSGAEVKTTCPQCSHTRKKKTDRCLNVNTLEGVFHCWHCGFAGKAGTGSLAKVDRPKVFTKPTLKATALAPTAAQWFGTRGITPAVLERNRIASAKVFMPQVGAEVGAVAFPYYRAGELVNCKYRDREKHFRMESGAERILYGYDDLAEESIIVEGEMDKLSVEVAGFPNCVSVPDGAPAPGTKNLASKFDFLSGGKVESVQRWVIAVDNDAPGACLRDELIRRFGAERCRLVSWPEGCKDANDVLVSHGPQVLRECIEAAQPVPIVGVFTAEDFADEFLRKYDEGVPRGYSTGWPTMDEYFRLQPGQLLIVTGIPGQGKSEWVDALCCNVARLHSWRSALYSPENQPTWLHIQKLAEKFIGKPYNDGPHERMTRAEAVEAKDWVSQFVNFIMPENPSLDEIMDKARALVLRKGIRVLVIDPWNEVEHNRPAGMTEAEYVSQSLMRLRRFARKHDLLVIVVAHPRLLEKRNDGTYPIPTPYDISGGAMWRNKADNCAAVYCPDVTDPSGAVEIHIQKVKFKIFGRVGMVPLKWDRLTGRYADVPSLNAMASYRRQARGDDD
jgi:twinkle protein